MCQRVVYHINSMHWPEEAECLEKLLGCGCDTPCTKVLPGAAAIDGYAMHESQQRTPERRPPLPDHHCCRQEVTEHLNYLVIIAAMFGPNI